MVRNRAPHTTSASNMEPTFYEENTFRNRIGGDVNHLKRGLTLDLDATRAGGKRPKFGGVLGAPVLSSPDLNLLKLGTPELEKFIIAQQHNGLTATPTPNTQILFERTVTQEQELYARGFEDALQELQNTSDSSDLSVSGAQPGDSSSGHTYTNLEPNGPGTGMGHMPSSFHMGSDYSIQLSSPDPSVIVKDEPQTVPSLGSTPPLSPIDMECQEKIKLERKRQRNRVAASKCRRRKLERISRLEDKVKLLKGENSELGNVVHKLKDQVCQLKEQVMDHVHSGCQIMMASHF